MTSRETEIANKITAYLDDATAELKAGTVYRLQLARADALARLSDPQRIVGSELAHALAGAAGGNLDVKVAADRGHNDGCHDQQDDGGWH